MMRVRARPCPRDERDGWRRNHDLNVRTSKSTNHEVCLVGASIIGNLTRYNHIWRRYFCETLRAVNFGIGGDRSQHALWRAMNGEIPPSTRCVAVNIGNNNIPRDARLQTTSSTLDLGSRRRCLRSRYCWWDYCHATKVSPSVATASRKSTSTSGISVSATHLRGFSTWPQKINLRQGQMAS